LVTPWAERYPDRLALVETAGRWTYKQLDSALALTRDWLVESGVRPGDRVMVIGENCRAFVAAFLALSGIDAWPVLVNARLSAREVDEIREHCGARRVIYTTGVSQHAAKHAGRHGAAIRDMGDLGPIGLSPVNELVEPEPIETDSSNRVAALIYTSGTTGKPKGVMLTHRNLLFMAAISAKIRSVNHEDRLLGVLPMSHAVGLSVVLLGSLFGGAMVYLMPYFHPISFCEILESERLTLLLGAPAIFAQLLEYAKLRGIKSLRFPALRIISSSGAPLHPRIKSEVESLFGMVLHNGFGVTECSPTIALTRVESPRADTSVGPAFPGVEIKLVGPEARSLAEYEVGELWVRGPNVMKGYYRAPQETSAVIDSEGWFNTRDLAKISDGNLFIVGRTKELIVSFGFNVYPAEVEAVLNAHPAVVRSAVIGQSVEGTGEERVIAFVQLEPGSSSTVAELAKHAAQHLAPYKVPSKIHLVLEMPLTPTGKVMKEELSRRCM
jgi:long-chain acyl-CoA synthetase